MGQTQITSDVLMWMREGFKNALGNESARWEIVFQVELNQEAQQLLPWVFLYTEIAAAQLGGVHQNLVKIPAIGLTSEMVGRYVNDVLESLWDTRSKALAGTNGHQGAPGKLILPGS